jgi:hypothetical protein
MPDDNQSAEESKYQMITFISLVGGVVLVVLTMFAVEPLQGTKFDYIWKIIRHRGPLPIMALFVGYMNVVSIHLLARRREPIPPKFIKQLLIRCCLPIALGIIGTIMGYQNLQTAKADVLTNEMTAEERVEAEKQIAEGQRNIWDPALLGFIVTIVTIMPASNLLSQQKEETKNVQQVR